MPVAPETDALFGIAFRHSPWGMVVCTPDGRYLRVNQAMCALLGYDEAEIVGRSFRDFTDPDDVDATVDVLRRIETESTVLFEKRYRRRDGGIVWTRVTGSVVRHDDGRPRFVIGQVQDVTEQRRRDEERVALEARLRRSQRMDAVGRMAGGIAHDFNNMLSVILNYADFARQRTPDAVVRQYLQAIRQAAARSAELTRQLMIFGRKDVAPTELMRLDDAIERIDQLLRRTLGEDVEVRLELDEVPAVELAPSHAEQILMNLAMNARDAMPRGGSFRIRLTEEIVTSLDNPWGARPGAWVHLAVSDNGVGMSPEVLALAMEPFFTTREPGQGTGLGLAIVYGIVEEAGGHLHIDSAPDAGTTVHVLLPPADELPADDPTSETVEIPRGGRGEVIIVVDDDPSVRELSVRVLRENGYVAHAAESARAAIALCTTPGFTVDLVVTDVIMPELSGVELAAQVRAVLPDQRVLFVSGHSEDRLAGHDLPRDAGFLVKPWTADDLLWAVRAQLDR